MKKKSYVMPQLAVIELNISHGLLAGSNITVDLESEFDLEVDEDFEDPYYIDIDAEDAD